jgi:hypothetical protein
VLLDAAVNGAGMGEKPGYPGGAGRTERSARIFFINFREFFWGIKNVPIFACAFEGGVAVPSKQHVLLQIIRIEISQHKQALKSL